MVNAQCSMVNNQWSMVNAQSIIPLNPIHQNNHIGNVHLAVVVQVVRRTSRPALEYSEHIEVTVRSWNIIIRKCEGV